MSLATFQTGGVQNDQRTATVYSLKRLSSVFWQEFTPPQGSGPLILQNPETWDESTNSSGESLGKMVSGTNTLVFDSWAHIVFLLQRQPHRVFSCSLCTAFWRDILHITICPPICFHFRTLCVQYSSVFLPGSWPAGQGSGHFPGIYI